jgi:cation transport regulator
VPYPTIADLPPAIRRHLPEHAQEIYRGAFNHAWQGYATHADREATAHRVAWGAVKRRYRKAGDTWVALDPSLR